MTQSKAQCPEMNNCIKTQRHYCRSGKNLSLPRISPLLILHIFQLGVHRASVVFSFIVPIQLHSYLSSSLSAGLPRIAIVS